MVDLALISALGQGDWEVTKVSCLHAAVSGFAPLIYDLKPTDGFSEFYERCKDVWQAYEADSNLPKKLVSDVIILYNINYQYKPKCPKSHYINSSSISMHM